MVIKNSFACKEKKQAGKYLTKVCVVYDLMFIANMPEISTTPGHKP
jgi:hypothetical protein